MSSSSIPSTHVNLIQSIVTMLADAERSAETRFIFQYFDIPPHLPRLVQDQSFFILQEATSNIVKHAHANNAFVQLYCRDQELIISIEDDGIGFNSVNQKGRGLKLMETRVDALRGTIEISSSNARGTYIMIVLPLT